MHGHVRIDYQQEDQLLSKSSRDGSFLIDQKIIRHDKASSNIHGCSLPTSLNLGQDFQVVYVSSFIVYFLFLIVSVRVNLRVN